MHNCMTLQKRSERNIPYILKSLKCRKGVSAGTNMWFEKGHIPMKESLGLIYSWLYHMTGQNAAGEVEVNKKKCMTITAFVEGCVTSL